MIISGVAWTGNLLCWIEGLEFTSTVRASVFANVHPLMLVIFFRVSGSFISRLEWLGVTVVMLGILLSACRDEFQKFDLDPNEPQEDKRAWIGDLLCLLAAFGEMVVLVDRMQTKACIPIIQVMDIKMSFTLFDHSCLLSLPCDNVRLRFVICHV